MVECQPLPPSKPARVGADRPTESVKPNWVGQPLRKAQAFRGWSNLAVPKHPLTLWIENPVGIHDCWEHAILAGHLGGQI